MYLDGWVNVDLPDARTFLASERPDLVQRWKTTEDRYYAKHQDKTQDTLRAGPLDQEYVCDRYGSFEFLPVNRRSAAEILCRQVFEHLSPTEAHSALERMRDVLTPGGILRIDVPDHERTMWLFAETHDPFYVRHLLGPRRNQYGYHLCGYTRDRLRALIEEHGFKLEAEEPNIHEELYPAFCLRFLRS